MPELQERPEPDLRWTGIWRGYWRLEGSRQLIVVPMGGAVPGRIEYSALSRWMEDQRIAPDSPAWHLHLHVWDAFDEVRAEHQKRLAEAEEAKRPKR